MNKTEYSDIKTKLKSWRIPAEVKKAAMTIDEKKGENIVILKLKNISDVTDFMIICNGQSSRQNTSISNEVEKILKKEFKLKPFGKEGERVGEWILLDYVDFIVHIFSRETRDKYTLEKFWMDAKRYDL